VILPLGFEDEWQLYKSYASESELKAVEVVEEITPLSAYEITVHETGVTMEETIADPIAVEQLSQKELQSVTHRVSLASEFAKTHSEALNFVVVTDEFDADTFDENVDTEQHVEEDEETTRSESDEENMQPSVVRVPDAVVSVGGEGNEANVSFSQVTLCDVMTSSHIDWGSYYTYEELSALKLKHTNVQDYPNHRT
jgi:hypothetical protein